MQNKKRLREELAELLYDFQVEIEEHIRSQSKKASDHSLVVPKWLFDDWLMRKMCSYHMAAPFYSSAATKKVEELLELLAKYEIVGKMGNKTTLENKICEIIHSGHAEYGLGYIASTEIVDYLYEDDGKTVEKEKSSKALLAEYDYPEDRCFDSGDISFPLNTDGSLPKTIVNEFGVTQTEWDRALSEREIRKVFDDGYDPGGPLNRTRPKEDVEFSVDLSSFGSNGANFVRQIGNVMRSVESGDVGAVEIVLHHADGGSSQSTHHFETGRTDG